MREYCQEAVNFGDAPIQVHESPRHIVVILNPASNKKFLNTLAWLKISRILD